MTPHTTPKIAVLAGATGLVGSSLLQLMLQSPLYAHVLSLGRRPLDLEHPKLTHHIVDFENLPSLHSMSAALAALQ